LGKLDRRAEACEVLQLGMGRAPWDRELQDEAKSMGVDLSTPGRNSDTTSGSQVPSG
jgi:hypothetical protein